MARNTGWNLAFAAAGFGATIYLGVQGYNSYQEVTQIRGDDISSSGVSRYLEIGAHALGDQLDIGKLVLNIKEPGVEETLKVDANMLQAEMQVVGAFACMMFSAGNTIALRR